MANQLLMQSGEAKSKLTIEQTILNLFSNAELSDVCFLVGDQREKVYAHRLILAAGSDVFKAMFYGELKEVENEIDVPDLTLVGFRNMIKYFYTKKLEIDLSEVHPTYLAANKYMALDLIQDLIEHIAKSCSDVSNVCLAYDQLLKLEIGDSLVRDAEKRIAAEFAVACGSDSFKKIDEDTLVAILKFKTLNITELELLKACLRWTDSEVARQHLGSDQASKRSTFEPIKHLIRFGDLSLSGFSSISDIDNYLTAEEIGQIFLQLNHKRSLIPIDYRSPRGPPKAQVARTNFVKNGMYNPKIQTGKFDQFSISANKRVRISSMQTFASSNVLSLKFQALSDKKEEIWSLDGRNGAGQLNDGSACWLVDFSESNFILEPNVIYNFCLLFTSRFDALSKTYPFYIGCGNTALKSDEDGAVFKIIIQTEKYPDFTLSFIENIDYWPL